MNEKIYVDVSKIPPYTQDVLAAAVLDFIKRVDRSPEGKKKIDEWLENNQPA